MVSESKKRLIDANALAETYRDTDERFNHEPWNLSEILDFLKDAPTVDAVEVVRCKECRFCDPENKQCRHPMSTILPISRKPDDFCSYGERKVPHV